MRGKEIAQSLCGERKKQEKKKPGQNKINVVFRRVVVRACVRIAN